MSSAHSQYTATQISLDPIWSLLQLHRKLSYYIHFKPGPIPAWMERERIKPCAMENWEVRSQISSHKFDHAWTANTQVRPDPDCKYNSYLVIGQLRSHETNRSRVSDNNNISQLLGDSFSVSQKPPIWEPPSDYSIVRM